MKYSFIAGMIITMGVVCGSSEEASGTKYNKLGLGQLTKEALDIHNCNTQEFQPTRNFHKPSGLEPSKYSRDCERQAKLCAICSIITVFTAIRICCGC